MQCRACVDERERAGGEASLLRGDGRSRRLQTFGCAAGRIRNRGLARGLAGSVRSKSAGCRRAGGSETADVQFAGYVDQEGERKAERTDGGGLHDFGETRITRLCRQYTRPCIWTASG